MYIGGRKLFLTALAAAFAALVVVYPSVSLSHALGHLEAIEAGDTSGEEPQSDAGHAELCGLCVSLSQGRVAVLATGLLAQVQASIVSHDEIALLPQVLSQAERAPASPRAPPLQ